MSFDHRADVTASHRGGFWVLISRSGYVDDRRLYVAVEPGGPAHIQLLFVVVEELGAEPVEPHQTTSAPPSSSLLSSSGDYEVSIKFNDEHIPDSPFIVPIATLSDDARRLTITSLQVRAEGPPRAR